MSDEFWTALPPSSGPAPKEWSFSALSEWTSCPRRFWLRRGSYSNSPSPYPERPNAAAVHGTVVHETLNELSRHLAAARARGGSYEDARRSFQVRFSARAALADILKRAATNPRADVQRLRSSVRLDEVVNDVNEIARESFAANWSSAEPRPPRGDGRSRLRSDEPPLVGEVDWLAGSVIWEFKTGERREEHVDQVLFYAALFLLDRGAAPVGLRLAHRDGTGEDIPVPSEAELRASIAAISSRVRAASEALASGLAPSAQPQAERCRFCPVRHLCDEFWSSPATTELRLGGTAPQGTRWLDVELNLQTVRTKTDGAASAPSLTLTLNARRTRPSDAVLVRMLGAMVETNAERTTVSARPTTELFWVTSAKWSA